MSPVWVWAAALVIYGAFSLWYNNWRGPLSGQEIDAYMARFENLPDATPERLAVARAFLEADDGGEFYMVNLIRLHPDPVVHPDSGEPSRAQDVLGVYTGYFMPQLFKRAGHPAFAAPAAGGYVEHWGVEENPGWTFSGVIRYRSRRDMMILATDPRFENAHAYKIAAIANTLAFPAAPALIFIGPRVWIGLGLALLAALGHLAVRTWGGSGA
jgi:hypothetical protein